MPGVDPPEGGAEPDDHDRDDEGSSGAPPDPLDRLWFHPSELGALRREPPAAPAHEGRRSWVLITVAALTGAITAIAVVAAAGLLHRSDGSSGSGLAGVGGSVIASPVANALSHNAAAIVALHVVGSDPSAVTDGSGIAISDRDVLTSLDVVSGAATVTVASRGRILSASVVGVDVATGLAVVRIQGGQLAPAQFGSSDALDIGGTVVGLGPFVEEHRWLTEGFVSAVGRIATSPQGTTMAGLIETSLRPVPGTAGAAVVNATGNVVGILVGPLPGSAMPMDWARDIASQLEETGQVHHAWLGAAVVDAPDVPGGGARIVTTTPLGPASVAGIAPGDVVVAVGDDRVSSAADLLAAVMQRRPGDPVVVKVRRLAVQLHKQVTLTERLATPVTDAHGAITG